MCSFFFCLFVNYNRYWYNLHPTRYKKSYTSIYNICKKKRNKQTFNFVSKKLLTDDLKISVIETNSVRTTFVLNESKRIDTPCVFRHLMHTLYFQWEFLPFEFSKKTEWMLMNDKKKGNKRNERVQKQKKILNSRRESKILKS